MSQAFLVDTIEEAVAAVWQIQSLDRVKVRAEFERRFTAARMARDYDGMYRQLLAADNRPAKVVTLNGRRNEWKPIRPSKPSELMDSEVEAQSVSASKSAISNRPVQSERFREGFRSSIFE